MRRREHAWVLLAIILLALATVVALSRQQANFDDHERLDDRTCELALQNRRLIAATLRAFVANASTPESIKQTAREQIAEVRARERELDCLKN